MKPSMIALAMLITNALTACGGAGVSGARVVGGPDSPSIINVQLNAQMFQAANGTESVELADARYLVVPPEVKVVAGTFQCHVDHPNCNNTVLRARLIFGNVICRYETGDITAASIPLLDCGTPNVSFALVAGTVITLDPLYAPGLLLETSFNLSSK